MAVVLAGTHVELDAPIAIKVLLPSRATSPDAVRRFLTEARAAAKLKSENVARISDVGTAATRAGPVLPFIVMERLDGVDLATLKEHRKRLPVDEAVDLVRQACRGLAEAHALGIIHRDIKPANLFLTRTREGAPIVKVLDFGISKTISSIDTQQQRAITADKEVMGSPGYMSPEQVKAAKNVDMRTDIWSLGVVLHELISGRDAFAGDALHEIFASILHGEWAAFDDPEVPVPDEVRAIVARCLQKDPAKRYQTIGALEEALARAVDRPQGVPAPTKLGVRGPLIAAAAAAFVIVGGVAIVTRGSHVDPDPSTPAALSLDNAITPAAKPEVPKPETLPVAPVTPPSTELIAVPTPSEEAPARTPRATKGAASATATATSSQPVRPATIVPTARKRTDW